MKILMISGKSGSGKDQFALFLKEQLETQYIKVCIIHFGDLVKWFLTNQYDWDGKKDEAGRDLLQHFGTDVMRKKFPTYWADVVSQFLSAAESDFDFALIPDWRFKNEEQSVRKYNKNVDTIRINRFDENGNLYINPALSEEQAAHASETELDDHWFDWMVTNNGTIEDLRQAAKEVSEYLMEEFIYE